MHFSTSAVILGLLSLAGLSSASPITNASTPALPEVINGTDAVFANNTTDGFLWLKEPARDRRSRLRSRSLAKRGDLPPRDRTLADHMENHGEGLPECYKKCMRSEDGKSQMHMGKS
ncbi:hypothetical protein FJTKL_07537 [Diaporthe vaccinii]|uniref:Uncharacterized protein n=1 Tax=Diaporthe vaccinii TaxID=105482 RepID=A0ABR4ETP6_9PEZI